MYRTLSRTLIFLGNGVLPQAPLAIFKIQQRLGMLKVKHLVEANHMTAKIVRLNPTIKSVKPHAMAYIRLESLSDALHGNGEDIYGQARIIYGILAQ